MTKEKTGRPPMFETPEELQKEIDIYFNNLPKVKRHTRDGVEYEMSIITITGLCLAIGFSSRQSFYDYEKKEGFAYTVKRARMFVEHEYETQLHSGNVTGAIFALKNMGWMDKVHQDTHMSGELGVRDISGMSDDELAAELTRDDW